MSCLQNVEGRSQLGTEPTCKWCHDQVVVSPILGP